MTQQEMTQIESWRGQTDKANQLLEIASRNGGPKAKGCFCKSTNKIYYINTFYTWYDKLTISNE